MTQSISSAVERHLAVDLHKHYLVIGGVNARQEVVLSPRRVPLDEWPTWTKTGLNPSDVLVVEATTNTWWFYDQTYQSVGQLLVADPRKIAWIAQTRVKTDAHDVTPALARRCKCEAGAALGRRPDSPRVGAAPGGARTAVAVGPPATTRQNPDDAQEPLAQLTPPFSDRST